MNNSELRNLLIECVDNKTKLMSVKILKEATGLGLKEAN